jgi:hypothetical protein
MCRLPRALSAGNACGPAGPPCLMRPDNPPSGEGSLNVSSFVAAGSAGELACFRRRRLSPRVSALARCMWDRRVHSWCAVADPGHSSRDRLLRPGSRGVAGLGQHRRRARGSPRAIAVAGNRTEPRRRRRQRLAPHGGGGSTNVGWGGFPTAVLRHLLPTRRVRAAAGAVPPHSPSP